MNFLYRLPQLSVPLVALTSFYSSAQINCQPQYHFDIKAHTSFNYAKLQSAPQTSMVRLQGVISIKPARKKEEQDWWGIKADNVVSVFEQSSTPLPSYEHPFAFKLNKKGLIDAFYFAEKIDKQTQDKLKGLAYYFQFQKDTSDIVAEPDTLGFYKPNYLYNQSQLHMSKQAYTRFDQTQLTTFNRINIIKSDHYILPSKCFLENREGSEALELVGQDLNFSSDQTYYITKMKKGFNSALFNMSDDISTWQPSHIELSEEEKARLAKALQQFITTQDITAIDAHTLAILLKQYDPVLGTLEQVILSTQLSDQAQMRLFNALGQLDSASSQKLLGHLLKAQKQPQTQFRALRALSQGNSALSTQAGQLLLDMLNNGFITLDAEVESSFYMTLGILLYNRPSSDGTAQIKQAITEQIVLNESEMKTASLIGALGNSRAPEHEALITEHLSNKSVRIEKASIRALGMMQTPNAYKNLEQHFFDSPHRNRKAMVSALGSFQMSAKASDSVLNIAVNDSNDAIRYVAISALAKQHNQAGIKPILRQALTKETSRRNFKAIVELLHAKESKVAN
ncbi:HEAT repeat domain-containing protein [Pseudoalteromonas sp. MMG022]|uniref:HEAT repeat domain-containing protein n=1 Tax=Pseudoalteromonas sp. MMG022 TaxID=2909978 RepID=UPI001F2315AD|nr:HEAT repeat domain-containing protein [Pseudoalteromonas sp. MMG022]MCF6437655.1 HEAT repeat domain-containing protein [Pseudoalteromonas sp. MMG022]